MKLRKKGCKKEEGTSFSFRQGVNFGVTLSSEKAYCFLHWQCYQVKSKKSIAFITFL